MAKRTIPLVRLTVGMYLTGVDRSWFQTPFLRHKFLIKDEREIAALRKAGITEVVVDTDLGLDPDSVQAQTDRKNDSPPSADAASEQPAEPASGLSERPSPVMLANNFAEARRQRQEWTSRTDALFERTRATDIVEIAEVRRIVDGVIESLLDRQAACLAVLGLRQPDATLQEHGLTVCTLSLVLGKAFNFPEDMIRRLGMGALLHDIGLAKLPRNIIKRPKAMAPAQQALYQTHAEQGVGVLEKSGAIDPEVLSIVRRHHEFDSASRDQSPSASGIDLAKLVSVIDQYDELITGQSGLTPLSSNQALTQLYQHVRSRHDWLRIVSSLIRTIGVYPLYSVVALNSGEVGVVGAITPGKAHLPFLYICRDQHRRPCVPPKPVDLIQEPEDGRRIQNVQDPSEAGIDVETVLKQVAA